jgi:glutathione S-transferase
MPFFVKPIAKAICQQVQKKLIDPNLATSLPFIEASLAQHPWFAGEHISLADFQMSFAIEAALARSPTEGKLPHLKAWLKRVQERPAYQRALQKGGPVIMSA